MTAPLYPGKTGNGRAVHLSITPGGRAVGALCGATVWTDAREADPATNAMLDVICLRCTRALDRQQRSAG